MKEFYNFFIYRINDIIYNFGYRTLYNIMLFIMNLFIFLNYYMV